MQQQEFLQQLANLDYKVDHLAGEIYEFNVLYNFHRESFIEILEDTNKIGAFLTFIYDFSVHYQRPTAPNSAKYQNVLKLSLDQAKTVEERKAHIKLWFEMELTAIVPDLYFIQHWIETLPGEFEGTLVTETQLGVLEECWVTYFLVANRTAVANQFLWNVLNSDVSVGFLISNNKAGLRRGNEFDVELGRNYHSLEDFRAITGYPRIVAPGSLPATPELYKITRVPDKSVAENAECSICHTELVTDVATYGCQHEAHLKCILEWCKTQEDRDHEKGRRIRCHYCRKSVYGDGPTEVPIPEPRVYVPYGPPPTWESPNVYEHLGVISMWAEGEPIRGYLQEVEAGLLISVVLTCRKLSSYARGAIERVLESRRRSLPATRVGLRMT